MIRMFVKKQNGAALFIALIFLVIITLIGVTALRTSTLELLMAGNEQERRIALDAVESASTVVAASDKIKLGASGEITCFGFDYNPVDASLIDNGQTCKHKENIPAGNSYGQDTFVQVTVKGFDNCPPAMASSARGNTSLYHSEGSRSGTCIYFTLEGLHDTVARRGARAETREGFIRLGY